MNLHTHKHPTSLMNNLHKRGHFGDILFQLAHLEWWTTLFKHKDIPQNIWIWVEFFFLKITKQPLILQNYRKVPQFYNYKSAPESVQLQKGPSSYSNYKLTPIFCQNHTMAQNNYTIGPSRISNFQQRGPIPSIPD